MVDPFGNHEGTGADDFAVAPYLDKACFGGADLGLHAGQRKRRADRLALALLKRSKPRLKLVTAGKRLAFLAGQLVEALRQPLHFAVMGTGQGVEARFQLTLALGGFAKTCLCRAAVIERHGHLDLADDFILVLIIGHVEDRAFDDTIEFRIA